ncbi:MAG: response regulator [Methylococcaceae bacterium]|nr:MAG: response regulator [Methylococcaceae bacterium]
MKKLLVVDDDMVVLATLTLGLRRQGYVVRDCQSSLEALEVCKSEPPDLAILDIRMPDIDGVQLGSVLARMNIPFLYLSAYADEELVKNAVETGALGYLVKPLEVAGLVPSIKAALRRAEDLAKIKQSNANLALALDSSREIDVAIGLLMGRFGFSRQESFEVLRRYARKQRLKLPEVAAAFIAGEMDADALIAP